MYNTIIQDKISFKKLNRDYLKAILLANSFIEIDVINKIERLITRAILIQIELKIAALNAKNKKHFTLTLTAAEALLFYKVHANRFINYGSYELMVVSKMILQIEKELIIN